jgi:hypothetical protein
VLGIGRLLCIFAHDGPEQVRISPHELTLRTPQAAEQPSGPFEVAEAEAQALGAIEVTPERPLRLHTVGDCSTDEAASIVSDASADYKARAGGPVWTYTHAWRDVSRESWGEVSVLASCETAADARLASERGYATAIVVDHFDVNNAHVLGPEHGPAAGVRVIPCREQVRGTPCSECRLCFNDERLRKVGHTIAFAIHGAPANTRRAKRALEAPDDPDQRLATRELIVRAIAELEVAGVRVTNAAIARKIGQNASSVAQMRKRMATEGASTMNAARRHRVRACPESGDSRKRSEPRHP